MSHGMRSIEQINKPRKSINREESEYYITIVFNHYS